jgi:hypothetical protein
VCGTFNDYYSVPGLPISDTFTDYCGAPELLVCDNLTDYYGVPGPRICYTSTNYCSVPGLLVCDTWHHPSTYQLGHLRSFLHQVDHETFVLRYVFEYSSCLSMKIKYNTPSAWFVCCSKGAFNFCFEYFSPAFY